MMLYKLVVLGDGGVGKVSIGWEKMPRFMRMHIHPCMCMRVCVCMCVYVCVRVMIAEGGYISIFGE